MNLDTDIIARARAVYLAFPKGRLEHDLETKKDAARHVWSDACLGQIDQIATVSESIIVFRMSPWGSPAKLRVLEKWVELCVTIEELANAWRVSSRRFHFENPALKKWEEFSCIEVSAATTVEEIRRAFINAPCSYDHSKLAMPSKMQALSNWLDRCSTLEEMRQVCEYTKDALGPFDFARIYNAKYEALYLKIHGEPLIPVSMF